MKKKASGSSIFLKILIECMFLHQISREMIDNGKDKLEWERKVDSSAVNSIKYISFVNICICLYHEQLQGFIQFNF